MTKLFETSLDLFCSIRTRFLHCLQAFGIEEANRLNKAAIKSLAAIEFRRVLQLFEIPATNTFEGLESAFDAAFTVSKGDFMDFSYSFPEKGLLCWEWPRNSCFAYQGMKQMGAIDRYQCGVLYRVLCWMENAGARCTVTPDLGGCLMHTQGRCAGRVQFSFT